MISARCPIKLSLILFTTGLITMGCQDPGPIASPDQTSARRVELLPMPGDLNKRPTASSSSSSTSTGIQSTSTIVTTSKEITVAEGGALELEYRQGATNNYGVTEYLIRSSISFAPGSISNDFTASFALDGGAMMSTISMEFGPHGTVFLQPANLSIYVSGLDLSYLGRKDEVKLFYDENGTWVEMEGDVWVNRTKGSINCINGKLPHFSRYAFGRVAAY